MLRGNMKFRIAALSLLLIGHANAAEFYDYATVLSSNPVYVGNPPRQVCNTVNSDQQGNEGYGGAIVGAVAGGIIGNQVGKGNGRTAATAVGAVTGALAGKAIAGSQGNQPTQHCQMVDDGSRQIAGYDVVYEYHGQRASVRLPRNPGPTIRVGISALNAN
ncbi:glycine zipper 2TM domain-containing protein [Herbaspirillum sp. HC18]|nr:glycine zipper 2TM domain-containing protein [Herbaspirillum sp. HC18]